MFLSTSNLHLTGFVFPLPPLSLFAPTEDQHESGECEGKSEDRQSDRCQAPHQRLLSGHSRQRVDQSGEQRLGSEGEDCPGHTDQGEDGAVAPEAGVDGLEVSVTPVQQQQGQAGSDESPEGGEGGQERAV